MISIDNLQHFIAVVENKGVNRAAEKIALSPSSITRSIHGIESQMGKKVFDRVGRRVVLNSAGRDLYARAKRLVQDFHGIALGSRSDLLTGHYQVGASHFLCQHFASKKLAGILKTHPNSSFDLFSLDTTVLVKRLLQGSLDFGLGISPRVPETISCTVVSTGGLYLCASKRHPLTKLPFTKLRSQLNEAPAVMHRPTDSVERCDNHPMFKAHGIKPKIRLYWDSDDVGVQMLRSGEFWTMLPDIVIAAHPDIRKLSHPAHWAAPYTVCLMRNKQRASEALEAVFR